MTNTVTIADKDEKQRPLNIALVVTSMSGGGAEKVVLELAKGLVSIGHKPIVVCLQGRRDYEIPQSVPIHFLYTIKRAKLYKKSQRTHHANNLTNLLNSLLGNSSAFDMVISNLDVSHYILSACDLPNTYYVIHNAINQTLRRSIKMGPFKYFRQKRLFQCLHDKNLIAVSKGLQKELLSQTFIKPRSVGQIYNPFDIGEIKSLANENNSQLPEEKYIVHVGRFAKQKRHDVLFDALKLLPDDIKLVCLAANSKGIAELAQRKGVSERVIVTGFQQNPYSWIANAECLVLSSDFEGFGNVLIEALVCKTRVVSTNCEYGPNEILLGDLAQNLVPIGNADKLAQSLGKALSEPKPTHIDFDLEELSPQAVAMKYIDLHISQNNNA